MKEMSRVEARFRLVQGGIGGAARFEALGRIQTRWGDTAAEKVRERVEAGTDQEVQAWLRRSAYFLDLESMLDLGRTLPVSHLRIDGLLDLLAAGDRPALRLILIRFSALDPRNWRLAEQAVPWLKDIPHAARALQHLCAQGWLLIGCGHREQGLALWRSVRRGRGILVSRYDLGGCACVTGSRERRRPLV
jgi:hypothetical protein